ncbi:SGNH/GDSL hydrolase family protein [Pseudorhodoplanes sp.]|uniref:SGNH/GDSL hydrolase family protein n=1 Tax=Pseudorhodoplanes sp. TaxID=1934341 RepID=UPI003D135158
MVIARPFPVRFCLLMAAMLAAGAGLARAEDRPLPQIPAAAPPCAAPDDMTRLMNPLARTARRLAAGDPVKIVAIGSSSTAGAGASAPDKSYPARLAVELEARFPAQPITVINRGVNGEEARDMVARLDAGVLAERPDLILWQVGANAVLRDSPIPAVRSDILEGLRRMKASGADVVLIDPQFAPKVLAKKDADAMVDLLATTAKAQQVELFRRFAVMRHWRQIARLPFEVFISPDDLHMNDWSYGCLAKLLAGAIAEAATRTTLTARAR